MFRPLTVIAITAFCVVGWNVYRAEDAARQLDREMREMTRKIDQARERTQVLRAEWALLNEPERLRQVAQKFLPLETMQPGQFVRMADLDRRMPVAVAFAGPVSLFGPAPGQRPTALAAAEAPAPLPGHPAAPVVAAARPAPAATPAPAPAQTQVARAEAPRAPVAAPAPTNAATPAPVTLVANRVEEPARRRPAPAPAQASTPAPAPRPQVAAREVPQIREQVAEIRPASTGLLRQAIHLPIGTANAAPVPQPVPQGSMLGGSALGGVPRGTLAPPVPLPVPVPVR